MGYGDLKFYNGWGLRSTMPIFSFFLDLYLDYDKQTCCKILLKSVKNFLGYTAFKIDRKINS